MMFVYDPTSREVFLVTQSSHEKKVQHKSNIIKSNALRIWNFTQVKTTIALLSARRLQRMACCRHCWLSCNKVCTSINENNHFQGGYHMRYMGVIPLDLLKATNIEISGGPKENNVK